MNIRLALLIFIWLSSAWSTNGQTKQYLYFLDRDLSSVDRDHALLVGKGSADNNKFKLMCYDVQTEKLVIIAFFSDSSISTFDGPFLSFYPNGHNENQGAFVNGYEDGLWQKWDSSGRIIDSIEYRSGKVVLKAHYHFNQKGKLTNYSFVDSIMKTAEYKDYDSTGRLVQHAVTKNNVGFLITTENGIEKKEPISTANDREAEFPGGTQGWTTFLRNNMNASVPVGNKAPEGTYQVIVRFTVKRDGSIENIIAETNHGFGMEREVISIIRKGPKWLPAIKFGKAVDAYRRQPATFVLQEN